MVLGCPAKIGRTVFSYDSEYVHEFRGRQKESRVKNIFLISRFSLYLSTQKLISFIRLSQSEQKINLTANLSYFYKLKVRLNSQKKGLKGTNGIGRESKLRIASA